MSRAARPRPRRPVLRSVVGAVLAVAALTWLLASRSPAEAATATGNDVGRNVAAHRQVDLGGDAEAGEQLYVEGCSSCHGAEGKGIAGRGPSLERSGPAAAHF